MGADVERELNGWALREVGPSNADQRVLLLPGAFCTANFYGDVLSDPRIATGQVRFVAATPPGFGGRPAPGGVRVEDYAHLTAELATQLGTTCLVGHSYFADVAIEMAATGAFSAPTLLLSPSFSRQDEERGARQVDRVSRIPGVGRLPWLIMPAALDSGLRGRIAADLIAEMKRNDMTLWRQIFRHFFDYLDKWESLVPRLTTSGVPASVVRGEHDEVGLTEQEHAELTRAVNVRLSTIRGARHFMMTDQPARTAEVILNAIGATPEA
jgi:pimeloyl-ACP methyl ester carboxylesterase